MTRLRARASAAGVALAFAAAAASCADPERDRLRDTTRATYDKATGKLTELTFDSNKNGRIDTWTDMDGTRPVRSRIDRDEDGRVDRWEYYDTAGHLTKVGFSRASGDKPDAWAFSNASNRIERIEASSVGDDARIDRWEFYDTTAAPGADGTGSLLRVEADTNGDGKRDKWERYENGAIATAEFDENGDGRPDRRLTYRDGGLVLIETGPDGAGGYKTKIEPGP